MISKKSHWGWGWADKFPSPDERRNLGQQVSALLGIKLDEVKEPVPLDAVDLPDARIGLPDVLQQLQDVSDHARASHTHGRSFPDIARGFSGEFDGAPDLVVSPRSEEDVVAVLDWASDNDVAVVPFGGGTSVVGGVSGGRQPDRAGVISLDLKRLSNVEEIDDVSLLARIQAGATGPGLEEQLSASGLSLRHFPQSFEFSTLGGWIATRAGGHYATVYTHIDDRVASTRMVTPAGLWESRTLPGSGAGPSPDRMVIGSEGTLGVITEAWVRLVRRPRFRARASARFDSFEDGVAATRQIAQSGLHPANCRLLDPREAMLHGVAFDMKAVLLLGFESADAPVTWALDQAIEMARAHGGEIKGKKITDTEEDRGKRGGDQSSWRQAFIEAPYLQNSMVSLGVIADTFETACTWSAFPAYHAAIVSAVKGAMKEACGKGLLACRFTHVYPDGPAPYYTFVAPADRPRMLEQWQVIKAAASDAIIDNGGTITHHHAVGRVHASWYEKQRPRLFGRVLDRAKQELDPAGILNPGVLGLRAR